MMIMVATGVIMTTIMITGLVADQALAEAGQAVRLGLMIAAGQVVHLEETAVAGLMADHLAVTADSLVAEEVTLDGRTNQNYQDCD